MPLSPGRLVSQARAAPPPPPPGLARSRRSKAYKANTLFSCAPPAATFRPGPKSAPGGVESNLPVRLRSLPPPPPARRRSPKLATRGEESKLSVQLPYHLRARPGVSSERCKGADSRSGCASGSTDDPSGSRTKSCMLCQADTLGGSRTGSGRRLS